MPELPCPFACGVAVDPAPGEPDAHLIMCNHLRAAHADALRTSDGRATAARMGFYISVPAVRTGPEPA